MINIPIYRAKKIDSDEYIEGDLFYEKYIIAKSKLNTLIADAINHIEHDILKNECINENCKIEHTQLKDMLNKLILNERFEHIYEIDQTTLSISFDGGKSFVKLSDLEIHTCTDFELKYTNMKMRDCKEVQPPNGSIFTVITDKGR